MESFNTRFNIHRNVNISYCHQGDVKGQRLPHMVFFRLMSVLEGVVRFLVDPLLLRTLSFYELSPNQCLPNFYRVVNCLGHLNQLYGLNLTHHDINFLYAIRGSLRNGYYLQIQITMVRLISCLPDSNRNSMGEFVRVSGNWLNGELTCPTSSARLVSILFFDSLVWPYSVHFYFKFCLSFIYLFVIFIFWCSYVWSVTIAIYIFVNFICCFSL